MLKYMTLTGSNQDIRLVPPITTVCIQTLTGTGTVDVSVCMPRAPGEPNDTFALAASLDLSTVTIERVMPDRVPISGIRVNGPAGGTIKIVTAVHAEVVGRESA